MDKMNTATSVYQTEFRAKLSSRKDLCCGMKQERNYYRH